MKRVDRREWLKWAAASLASSVVAPAFLTACGDRILYINVMNNLSVDCDCDSSPAAPEMQRACSGRIPPHWPQSWYDKLSNDPGTPWLAPPSAPSPPTRRRRPPPPGGT